MNYRFYYPEWNNRKEVCKEHPQIREITKEPIAFWYGVGPKRTIRKTKNSIKRLLNRADPYLPILVVYSIPYRDLGHHSKGGANSDDEYLEFIQEFCDALGDRSPIVIYEPDCIPHMEQMGFMDGLDRMKLIKASVELLSRTNALVYLDIGHPTWLSVPKAVSYLRMCDIHKVRGFSINTSNYYATSSCYKYGKDICKRLDGDTRFVIDTSRNGNGANKEHFNPYGRAIGQYPTTKTRDELVDAYLWIKVPGESDGKVNGGPKAGRFSHQLALDLIHNKK
jgi:endoglucanase